jgi:hypothetical protein
MIPTPQAVGAFLSAAITLMVIADIFAAHCRRVHGPQRDYHKRAPHPEQWQKNPGFESVICAVFCRFADGIDRPCGASHILNNLTTYLISSLDRICRTTSHYLYTRLRKSSINLESGD